MASVTEPITKTHMTVDEFLALPEADGVERWLIDGELWEKPMSHRSPIHARVEATVARKVGNWAASLPKPRFQVMSGEVRTRLRKDAETIVGIDVVCTGPNPEIGWKGNMAYLDGPPLLAVEIPSPTDEQVEIKSKVVSCLRAGVPLVWVVDPEFQTVTVHRPGAAPVLFNVEQELTADPVLPGFRVPVAELFAE
jgi:Uma2 family endonuclease